MLPCSIGTSTPIIYSLAMRRVISTRFQNDTDLRFRASCSYRLKTEKGVRPEELFEGKAVEPGGLLFDEIG